MKSRRARVMREFQSMTSKAMASRERIPMRHRAAHLAPFPTYIALSHNNSSLFDVL